MGAESFEKTPLELLRETMASVDVFNVDYKYEFGRIQESTKYATKAVCSYSEDEAIENIPKIATMLDSALSPSISRDEFFQYADASVKFAEGLTEAESVKSTVDKIIRNTLFRACVERINSKDSWSDVLSRLSKFMREIMHDDQSADALDEIYEVLRQFIETSVDQKAKSELLVKKANAVGKLPKLYGFRDRLALFTAIPEELEAVNETIGIANKKV